MVKKNMSKQMAGILFVGEEKALYTNNSKRVISGILVRIESIVGTSNNKKGRLSLMTSFKELWQ
jgi:hypothetical protein